MIQQTEQELPITEKLSDGNVITTRFDTDGHPIKVIDRTHFIEIRRGPSRLQRIINIAKGLLSIPNS